MYRYYSGWSIGAGILHLNLLSGIPGLARHRVRDTYFCARPVVSGIAIFTPGCQIAGITCRPEPHLRALEDAHGCMASVALAAITLTAAAFSSEPLRSALMRSATVKSR